MENKEESRTAENPAPAENAPAVNPSPIINPAESIATAPAEIVTAAELIPTEPKKPKRGRPPGSTVANGAKKPSRDGSGKFTSTAAENPEQPPLFDSVIPGEENGPGGPGAENSPGVGPGQAAPAKVDYKATAQFIVIMATNSLAGLIGPEWKPDDKTEEDFLVSAVEAYLITKQTAEIPPGMMLTIAIAAYSTKRLQHQNTKTFLGKMKERALKLAFWFKLRFSRKTAPALATLTPLP